mmetsp:Transcript_28993/g.58427  ORF Transcript_28993/g.58427 Transcript_28993/m.58427 type:complete len:90 (-) Transcript_28993:398-667(-)
MAPSCQTTNGVAVIVPFGTASGILAVTRSASFFPGALHRIVRASTYARVLTLACPRFCAALLHAGQLQLDAVLAVNGSRSCPEMASVGA